MSEDPKQFDQNNSGESISFQTEVTGQSTANQAGRDINIYYGSKDSPSGAGLKVPFLAPPLPYYYVARPEHTGAVKAHLLTTQTDAPGTLVVSAIYGLGGIGKSVLATALAHDPEVQARFTDGVLWVTLGQQPDLLPELGKWIQALGDKNFKPTSLESAKLQLRLLLQEKRMLLVVDDVWETEHAEPFRIGGQHCCVLITTREAVIKDCIRYPLDEMTAQQSLTLLTQKLGQELTPTEAEQANALAQKVGYLPLALELAAAQIENGVGWGELLEDLEGEITNLETLDDPLLAFEADQPEKQIRNRSLYASFNLSLKQLPPDHIKQFAWLGILPEDIAVNTAVASKLWDIKPEQARTLLQDFLYKSLLMTGGKQVGDDETYRMHDLVHDIARCMLTRDPEEGGVLAYGAMGLSLAEAHSTLLERYRAQTPTGQWHELEEDGYIYAQLTWHMKQAEREDQIHQLFQETTGEGKNGWYEACDRLGKLSYFVTDLGRAWALAEQHFEQDATESIVLQWRYALIQTTLNSVAENIPAELLARLVETGFWSVAQGLAYAQQVQSPSGRSQAISELAPHLPESLLPEALELTRNINHESYRARALSALAPQLPEYLLPEALELTRNINYESYRAVALSALAPQLPESLVPQAVEVTRNINNESDRARALSALAPKLPELWPEALEVTRSINNESSRAGALSALALQLPESLVPEALEVTRNINNKSYRAEALSDLAPQLPNYLLPEALKLTRNTNKESPRAKALIALAPQLPELWPEALEVTRNISDECSRTEVLRALAPQLPTSLLPEALGMTRNINDKSFRAWALSSLAQQLPELWPEALEATRNINHKYSRADVLSTLAQQLPELWLEALEVVTRNINDEYFRAKCIIALAPRLPESLLPEALEMTCNINDESDRTECISALAPQLPESLLPEALEMTRHINDESSRAEALSALAPQLPELWPEALEVTRHINNESSRAECISALAPQWPELWLEALEVTRNIKDEYSRTECISALAPQLPESLLSEAWEIIRHINSEYFRAKCIIALAPQLPESLLPEALQMTRDISEESSRAEALSALVPQLPELLPEALKVIRHINDEYLRAECISALAPQLSESLLPEVLEMTRNITFEPDRATALSALAPQLPMSLLPEALEMTRNINDVSPRAWVLRALAPQLPELWPEALEVTRNINNASYCAKTFCALAPQLPELWPEALGMTRNINSEKFRAEALSVLAPQLPESLMDAALKDTNEIKDLFHRALALSAFLNRLDLCKLESWQETLRILSTRQRQALILDLPKLERFMVALGGRDALDGALQAMREVCEQWK